MGFLGHYVWLFKMDITQKDYIKKLDGGKRKKLPTSRAMKRLVSIMLTRPASPIPEPELPFNAFCYLPPGQYIP